MPTPKPLLPNQAAQTLAHRFAGRADRLRQLNTKFGIRPYRVFLVWRSSQGQEYGTGNEQVERRVEILPAPKVKQNLTLTLMSGGIVPMGSVVLTEVSAKFSENELTGKVVPDTNEVTIPQPYEFHYEVVEDGRDGSIPKVGYYRPLANPTREAGNVHWTLTLAPVSEED